MVDDSSWTFEGGADAVDMEDDGNGSSKDEIRSYEVPWQKVCVAGCGTILAPTGTKLWSWYKGQLWYAVVESKNHHPIKVWKAFEPSPTGPQGRKCKGFQGKEPPGDDLVAHLTSSSQIGKVYSALTARVKEIGRLHEENLALRHELHLAQEKLAIAASALGEVQNNSDRPSSD